MSSSPPLFLSLPLIVCVGVCVGVGVYLQAYVLYIYTLKLARIGATFQSSKILTVS